MFLQQEFRPRRFLEDGDYADAVDERVFGPGGALGVFPGSRLAEGVFVGCSGRGGEESQMISEAGRVWYGMNVAYFMSFVQRASCGFCPT